MNARKAAEELLQQWLEQADPTDRHRLASAWELRRGPKPLAWIVRQDECDRGTAMLIYWRVAAWWARTRNDGRWLDLAKKINRRDDEGFYSRAELAFDPATVEGADRIKAEPRLSEPVAGASIEPPDDFLGGVPPEVRQKVHDLIAEVPAEKHRLFADWLRSASPAQWHKVARGWNWQGGIRELSWIARQPTCDRATALMIFWRGSPRYFAQFHFADEVPESRFDEFQLLRDIERRYLSGFYEQCRFTYDPRGDAGHDLTTEIEVPQRHVISEDLCLPAWGDEAAPEENYPNGIPPEVAEAHQQFEREIAEHYGFSDAVLNIDAEVVSIG
ncbi:DUF4274 domain-containing protein [Stratiformator vulcanicus]|uniref:DUF4274 domain-containing protein n=1 Tax=Stratiformator vulcanicus TaxID=2527980 RepID=A0A517R4N7_9PLAN|nr:DUF4274 domain-containing protein [Stratiformator vulcanicus]QDT38831.1 hypothetical protein Pan189_32300 [Stratiformator vulcanicus]